MEAVSTLPAGGGQHGTRTRAKLFSFSFLVATGNASAGTARHFRRSDREVFSFFSPPALAPRPAGPVARGILAVERTRLTAPAAGPMRSAVLSSRRPPETRVSFAGQSAGFVSGVFFFFFSPFLRATPPSAAFPWKHRRSTRSSSPRHRRRSPPPLPGDVDRCPCLEARQPGTCPPRLRPRPQIFPRACRRSTPRHPGSFRMEEGRRATAPVTLARRGRRPLLAFG